MEFAVQTWNTWNTILEGFEVDFPLRMDDFKLPVVHFPGCIQSIQHQKLVISEAVYPNFATFWAKWNPIHGVPCLKKKNRSPTIVFFFTMSFHSMDLLLRPGPSLFHPQTSLQEPLQEPSTNGHIASLVGGFSPTHLKNMLVKLGSFPQFSGWT